MVKIVTIDGPSGSGKGSIANLLSERLGWHCLDSGALYRLVGYGAERAGISLDDADNIAELVRSLDVRFDQGHILLNNDDVTDAIRTESVGNSASKVAALPKVREALLDWQREYAREPGLVADGRDMGSVVFPQAEVKIFLDANAEERAKRRYNQLKGKGLDVNLASLVAEIEERDRRDRNRQVAPLVAPEGAVVIESTALSIPQVLDKVLEVVTKAYPGLIV